MLSLIVAGVEGERAVYVMLTLRFDFHIGRVECVTCHLPSRKERGGGSKEEVVGEMGYGEVVGDRRVTGMRVVG